MATTSKLSFRARNLDGNRPMRVYFTDELPDVTECTPIARGVNPMPTGMEKEEEMETHLQDAILAQQASTSGISDNHVIPTPKVLYIDDARYDEIYPVQPPCKAQLMKVQAWLSMEREEAEYDMDSEDEEYLRDKPHISSRDLEKIMADLEAQSSESAICQPATARKVLMPNFDDNVIDDVYDYWLSKRKEAATNKTLGFGGLIPRIRTECRKENEKLNPYVAFRRRAEKMQTRKNRKNDEDSYEKVLRLGHDLRRAVHLFEMVKRREKSKLAMIDLDSEILEARAKLGDYGSVVYNQILAKLQPEEERVPPTAPTAAAAAAASVDPALQPLRGEENGVKRKKMRKRVSMGALGATFDRDLPNKAWLKKNAEVWNQSPAAFISGMGNFSPAVEQVDQSVAAANTANADGRYAFKRRKYCNYRPPAPLKDKNGELPSLDSFPPERRFHYVSMPSTSREAEPMVIDDETATAAAAEGTGPATAAAAASPSKKLMRRRIGRGGRVVFDLFPLPARRSLHAASSPKKNAYVAGRRQDIVIHDPFELDCIAMDSEETSKWEARRRPTMVDDEDSDDGLPPLSSRYLHSARYRRTSISAEDALREEVAERDWLETAVSPSPSPEPPAQEEMAVEATPTEVEEGEDETSSPPKRPTPIRPQPPPGSEGPGAGGGGCTPSEHEDSTTAKGATPRKKSSASDVDDRLRDVVIDYGGGGGGAKPSNGAAAAGGGRRRDEEDATMDEDGASSTSTSSASSMTTTPIEDSPTSSSEQDATETAVGPLGPAPAVLAHHNHNHQQLHLAGNASVLSPPDSTAPSPRVANGGSGALLVAGSSPLLAAIPSPHSNGHSGHAGSGNGVASGYEAARIADNASLTARDADAWRMRSKLVSMDVVASRLNRVSKDPDASSRESGCSPTEKSLPHSPSEDGEGVVEEEEEDGEAVDGVVVQRVQPMQQQQQKQPTPDCWRQPSNSPPSESNSSSDWTPPASTRPSGDAVVRLTAYSTLTSEEESGARTGDHPSLPAKPTRKPNGAAATQQMAGGLSRSAFALAAAATTP